MIDCLYFLLGTLLWALGLVLIVVGISHADIADALMGGCSAVYGPLVSYQHRHAWAKIR